MADLAASAVTINSSKQLGDRQGRYLYTEVDATCVLTGQGGTTNTIPASVLGLSSIISVDPVVTDSNTIYPASRSYDGTYIIIADAGDDTAENHVNAADLTDTVKILARGRK